MTLVGNSDSDGRDENEGLTWDVFDRLTLAMRDADEAHQRSGGGTRHYLRECFLPSLREHGLHIAGGAE